LRGNGKEHTGKNEADDIAAGLIEYRHTRGTKYNLQSTDD
jgi:hypothetical protein